MPQVSGMPQKKLYHTFVNDKIDNCEKALSDTIPIINLYTFQNHPPIDLNKERGQAISAKISKATVTRFHVNLKYRPESDVNNFFKHGSVRDSPTFSINGKLHSGNKAAFKLLECPPNIPKPCKKPLNERATVALFDMAAVGHMVKPSTAVTFKD